MTILSDSKDSSFKKKNLRNGQPIYDGSTKGGNI